MPATASIEANATLPSNLLIEQAKTYIEKLATVATSALLIKFIQTEFIEFCTAYIALGEEAYAKNGIDAEENNGENYILHFTISETFKDFMLLHRDVNLQLQISKYKQTDGVVTVTMVKKHFEACKSLLLNAANTLLKNSVAAHTTIYLSDKTKRKALDSITHRKNPWEIYNQQFHTILKQHKSSTQNGTTIAKTQKVFKDITAHNTHFLNHIVTNTEDLVTHLGEAMRNIKELKEPEGITAIITWMDTTILSVSKEYNLQELYSNTIETKLKELCEITVPVNVDNGLLLTKKIDFTKTAKKWLDYEILPSLIDLWENKNNVTSYFKHSILNLRSSLLVEKNNASIAALPSQLQTLQKVHASLTDSAAEILTFKTEIESKFNHQFRFTTVYNNEEFLEVSLKSSLNQFKSGQSNIFTTLKDKFTARFSYFNSKYEQNILFSKKNEVEDAIQTINYRMFKVDNAHYDTLFLNKNFIGDLFLLPRQEQETMLVRSINQWKNGFNKAVLLTGDALSGKTTFVEYISEKYFGKNRIQLKPDTTITFGGRKFTTTKNLQDALQNIKKGFSDTKVLITLEDLELWRSTDQSVLHNVRSLLSFIATESNNAFILVTASKQMQEHLNKRVRFTETFSAVIDLNKASFDEIYKAIILRHGASHKLLVSETKETLSTKQIEQNVLKLSRKLDYNIGEVLQAWTYGTTAIEDNQVVYNDKDVCLVDFFNTEEHIILKYLFIYKKINEIELKNFVCSTYEDGYKSSLKRLINIKILMRDAKGLLTLNPVVIMDIKQILIYRGTII